MYINKKIYDKYNIFLLPIKNYIKTEDFYFYLTSIKS